MPRTSQRYSNRTDLIGPAKLPNQQAPGQTYGDRAAQQAAQRALPMAPTPVASGPGASPGPPVGGAGPGAAPPNIQDLLAQAQAHNGPGDVGALDRPTERPNEPVTHGLPQGPGGGPEVLQGVGAAARVGAVGQGTLSNLLNNMAGTPGATTAVQDLAQRLAGGST